jgi:hypothetical protein
VTDTRPSGASGWPRGQRWVAAPSRSGKKAGKIADGGHVSIHASPSSSRLHSISGMKYLVFAWEAPGGFFHKALKLLIAQLGEMCSS